WDIDREAMDAYAERSHQRAAAVASAGEFCREIVPIRVPSADETTWISVDETICPTMTVEVLEQMPATFADNLCRAHYRDGAWNLTVGNSSQTADAATAMLIMSERRARQLDLVPRARFRSFAVVAEHPDFLAPGPITATDLALKKVAMSVDQLDHVEVNETFAAVPLAWQATVGVHPEFLNPRGGAIALGHPRGASGIRLMTTMLTALEDTGGRFGLQATWEAVGVGTVTIIERL
ncbi:MAG: steroid 3-ketoacyl-CoA thiolase, partial [Mycobacterium sp.]